MVGLARPALYNATIPVLVMALGLSENGFLLRMVFSWRS
jgi:hypothetical protein